MGKWFDDKDAVMVDVDFDTLECEMEFVPVSHFTALVSSVADIVAQPKASPLESGVKLVGVNDP